MPVEIESTATFTGEFLKDLVRFRESAGARVSAGYLIYNGRERFTVHGVGVFNPFLHRDPNMAAGFPG